MSDQPIDIAKLRAGLAGKRGRAYWRSLDELAGTESFRRWAEAEFPEAAPEWNDAPSRRRFLTLMGASLALAGVSSACTRQPKETIVPYVQPPEEFVPGRPLHFATAMPLAGYGTGLLVESHMGRPTKIEGNPDHPSSLGASDVFTQASILGLYDPDRSQVVKFVEEIRPWGDFVSAMKDTLEGLKASQGAGLRLLTGAVTSPTLVDQIVQLLAAFPKARWHRWEPAGSDAARAGAIMAFGEPVSTHYRFDRADVILSLDADFLAGEPGSIRYARDFSGRRRVDDDPHSMNRLYVVESTPTITGSVADHRLPLRAADVSALARSVAGALGLEGGAPLPAALDAHEAWAAAVARDLKAHAGSCLVLAGRGQPAEVHALAHAINHALGNAGATVVHTGSVEADPVDHAASLRSLADDMEAGQVGVLAILEGNPVYTAPADLRFAARMEKVGLRIHLGLYEDETARLCHWHIPQAHYLESWSDVRAHDGTVSIVQPLIEPLYDGRTSHEILAVLAGKTGRSGYDLVRETWRPLLSGGDFERLWERALHDGVVAGTALPEKAVALRPGAVRPASDVPAGGEMEIVFRADPSVLDGSFANNGWLQELPRPFTKITWDNAACVSPADAERLGLASEDVVELSLDGRKLEAPVFVLPGQAVGSVAVHLGYGRARAGKVAAGVGFDAYALRTSGALWSGHGLAIARTGRRFALATTQQHHSMEGRELVRAATLEHFLDHPDFAEHMGGETPPPEMSMYPPHPYEGHAWGMAVDLNACIGCNACMVACTSENNVSVVGKQQVIRGREMHWIRLDSYWEGGPDNPSTYHQPVMCQHCENAPCEPVCPVGATVHSSEGLNDMVYNRCVGTRYCSNNCPYKVRRFNFYLYSDWYTPSLKMARNPDVTVRSRGVMEKCTYCVQRINQARIQAHKEDRDIRDGEVVTACQQACPAGAIVFGDVNDPDSRVSKLKARKRTYGLLAEVGTRPRTTYMAIVRNPNPEIGKA